MQTNSKVKTNQNNFNPLLATPLKHFTVRRVSFGLQHCRKFFRIFGIDTDQQYSRAWTWWWTEYRNQGILVHVLSYFFWLKDGSRVRSPLFDSKTFHWDHDPMNYDDQCFFCTVYSATSFPRSSLFLTWESTLVAADRKSREGFCETLFLCKPCLLK